MCLSKGFRRSFSTTRGSLAGVSAMPLISLSASGKPSMISTMSLAAVSYGLSDCGA
jgi:hypothetical protein